MKNALRGLLLLCSLLACSTAFAQDRQQNAAADALKKRLEAMKLINPPNPAVILPPRPDPAAPVAAAPKICAVPLLNAIPPAVGGTHGMMDKMPLLKPAFPVIPGDVVRVPAPACQR